MVLKLCNFLNISLAKISLFFQFMLKRFRCQKTKTKGCRLPLAVSCCGYLGFFKILYVFKT